VAGEIAAGLDSVLVDSMNAQEWDAGKGASIHVVHSHIPDGVRQKNDKIVWVGHGTPEHVFQSSVEAGLTGGYGASDPFMLIQYWLKEADTIVTFWPRHKAIWGSLCDRNKKIHCIPMGVDKDFWKPVESRGKYAGSPSVFTAENCHYIKWPLDLFIAWPWVAKKVEGAMLHVNYLPNDQHRFWFPLIQQNGAAYKSYISANVLGPEDLRNVFNSVDYYIGLVRYGEHNRVCLEAKASGCKIISYKGNKYADYWVDEGDQRKIAHRLISILTGKAKPRKTKEVPNLTETVEYMQRIYEEL
jgi:hypothetical protein